SAARSSSRSTWRRAPCSTPGSRPAWPGSSRPTRSPFRRPDDFVEARPYREGTGGFRAGFGRWAILFGCAWKPPPWFPRFPNGDSFSNLLDGAVEIRTVGRARGGVMAVDALRSEVVGRAFCALP